MITRSVVVHAPAQRVWDLVSDLPRMVITEATPGVDLAFDVTSFGLGVSTWSYAIEDHGDSCTPAESWQDRRGVLVTKVGGAVAGVADREGFTAESIDATLAAVKAAHET